MDGCFWALAVRLPLFGCHRLHHVATSKVPKNCDWLGATVLSQCKYDFTEVDLVIDVCCILLEHGSIA